MKSFTVSLNQPITGKTKTKAVQANDWQGAYTKAVSNYMMANGWGVTKIADAAGVTVWQPGCKALAA